MVRINGGVWESTGDGEVVVSKRDLRSPCVSGCRVSSEIFVSADHGKIL